jgi:thioredoxin 2
VGDVRRGRRSRPVAVESPLPVLVDLWAPWCGPCRAIAPGVKQAARQLAGRLKVVKVNVDRAPGGSARFGAQGIPLLLVLHHGRVVDRQVGALPADALVRWTSNAVDCSAA